jgi:hypothetical protein
MKKKKHEKEHEKEEKDEENEEEEEEKTENTQNILENTHTQTPLDSIPTKSKLTLASTAAFPSSLAMAFLFSSFALERISLRSRWVVPLVVAMVLPWGMLLLLLPPPPPVFPIADDDGGDDGDGDDDDDDERRVPLLSSTTIATNRASSA